MTLLLLASATDIAHWAATRASQDRVPELLRRLVYSTTNAPQYIDFPSGDAVQLDGWDGAVELAPPDTTFVFVTRAAPAPRLSNERTLMGACCTPGDFAFLATLRAVCGTR